MSVALLVSLRMREAARMRRRPESPAELARHLDPKFVVTPTIRLLSDIAVRSVTRPNQRDIANAPPRTGKSEMIAVWTPTWALIPDPVYPMKGPHLQIGIISNGDELAQEHSRKIREIVKEHHEFLGYRIAADKTAVGRWRVEGHKGGILAAGINSHIVGFGFDLMLLDDVVGGAAEADSEAHRRRILKEYQGSLSTRVHPGGSIVLLMTRWNPADLAGELLRLQPGRWHHTNIPAVSDLRVPDALGRKRPGVAMVSALGFTAEDFEEKRATVGERQWFAQYMGSPSTPTGGLVKTAWLDDHRIAVAPRNPLFTVVAVDPSDSGEGDSCGIVAVSRIDSRRVALIADRSAPMTSDAWANAAVRLAGEVGASEIAVEAFAARETYLRVVREALQRAWEEGRLQHSVVVTAWPPKGRTRVGDAVARSGSLLQDLEVGKCVLAGHHPEFEVKATSWQAGQHQPDSLAALVIGHDVAVRAAGQEWGITSPADLVSDARRAAPVVDMTDWMHRKLA